MSAHLLTFTPEMDVLNAINQLLEQGISGAPVVDRLGNLVGMLSEKDCMRVALNAGYHGDLGGKVRDFMSPRVVTIDADTSILEVARMFMESPFKRYPVVSDNRLVGNISRHDVLRAIDSLRGNIPV
ncbi:CBS domain-containing protein [Algiphilus sp.]|nr:CBS domain-containing protein [Algiphilus acroporae]MCI5062124.1 CBS domain-containing protein [Algiphilus sp.]MCI5102911.1 CBS domain-containing protein [Algiphilus sp.]